jgi:hypothetical protein
VAARLRNGYMYLERAVELEGGAAASQQPGAGAAQRLTPQQMESSLERLFEGGLAGGLAGGSGYGWGCGCAVAGVCICHGKVCKG